MVRAADVTAPFVIMLESIKARQMAFGGAGARCLDWLLTVVLDSACRPTCRFEIATACSETSAI